ncbi:hypothetical protein BGZ46_003439 [Entomortierella lignicola]|nr:hypothetical protein BGZ46_003439 [Entomortierella lignicola]
MHPLSSSLASRIPLQDNVHIQDPFHTDKHLSPRQPLQPQRRHRDLDRLDDVQREGSRRLIPSSIHEETPHEIDPWPRNYSSQKSSTFLGHPLARPLVFDQGSYDAQDMRQISGDSEDTFKAPQRRSHPDRHEYMQPNGIASIPPSSLEYNEQRNIRRTGELTPFEGERNITLRQDNHSSIHYKDTRPKSDLSRGNNGGIDRRGMNMSDDHSSYSRHPYSTPNYSQSDSHLRSHPDYSQPHTLDQAKSSPHVGSQKSRPTDRSGAHIESRDRYYSHQQDTRPMHQHRSPQSSPIDIQSSAIVRSSPGSSLSSSPSQPQRQHQPFLSNSNPKVPDLSNYLHRQRRSLQDSQHPGSIDQSSRFIENPQDHHEHDIRSPSQQADMHMVSTELSPYSRSPSNQIPEPQSQRQMHGSDGSIVIHRSANSHQQTLSSSAPSSAPSFSMLHFQKEYEATKPFQQRQINKALRMPKLTLPGDIRPLKNITAGGKNVDNNGANNDDDDENDDNFTQIPGHKFGTEMPKTIDTKSAIEACDLLCKFALHFASQDGRAASSAHPDERVPSPHQQSIMQNIRNLNSTMLTGIQPSDRTTTDGEPTGEDRASKVPGDAPMADGSSTTNDAPGTKFGEGPPSDELVHEFAKAATSLFQVAIRVKGWVGMSPEDRILDEEINIIRGKRCLFMDGLTTMPLPSLDSVGPREIEWSLGHARGPNDSETASKAGALTFRRPVLNPRLPGERDGEYSQQGTPHGSYKSNTSSQSGMATSLTENGLVRSKSSTSLRALGGSEKGDGQHQKYRKRAKRTHPPGRCLSCDSSDTPEWRRGPDGARTLCNACGLHYAKLVKRQNQKLLEQQQSANQDGNSAARSLVPSSHMMGIDHQFRRQSRPDHAGGAVTDTDEA